MENSERLGRRAIGQAMSTKVDKQWELNLAPPVHQGKAFTVYSQNYSQMFLNVQYI